MQRIMTEIVTILEYIRDVSDVRYRLNINIMIRKKNEDQV